jgi:hypothetical protein
MHMMHSPPAAEVKAGVLNRAAHRLSYERNAVVLPAMQV